MDTGSSTCVAVLAAGASKRMGACKLAAPFAGSTLLERALDAACGCGAAQTVVVTGAHRSLVAPLARARGACEAHNPAWECGQSTSVRAAARFAAAHGFAALLVMVADQPYLEARHLAALLRARAAGDADAYVAESGGRRGNPCLFDARCFPLLETLTGDEGARALLRAHPALRVRPVRFEDADLFDDVDTPRDAARLEEAMLRVR